MTVAKRMRNRPLLTYNLNLDENPQQGFHLTKALKSLQITTKYYEIINALPNFSKTLLFTLESHLLLVSMMLQKMTSNFGVAKLTSLQNFISHCSDRSHFFIRKANIIVIPTSGKIWKILSHF